MTTDSVFILFKKTDFNTILACLGGTRCIGDGGVLISLTAGIGDENLKRLKNQI